MRAYDNHWIKEQLEALKEPEYQKFTASLLPGVESILGVRLPKLRELAKKLAKDNWKEYLQEAQDDSMEEIMLQGMTLGYAKGNLQEKETFLRAFIPKIDNWSVCDSCCNSINIAKEQPEEMWEFLQEYLHSEKEFEIRFALVQLLDYYVKEEGSAVKELQEQEANYEDYMTYYFTEQYGNIELQSGSCFDWVDDEGNFQSIDISTEDAQGLVEAFKQDIASGEYCIYPYGAKERVKNTYVNTLTICYTPPKGAHLLQYGVDATTTWDIADGRTVEYTGIILTKACKNTIAQLEKMGYVDEKHKLMTEEVFQSIFDSEDIY